MSVTVLVVDDEKPLRDFVRRNLEAREYRVLSAYNGLEALAIFKNEQVDLVILDIMMPHLDGLETARRIREDSLVPIIILTAMGEEADKVRAFDLGVDDYLTKPFGVGELLGRIKAVLRRSSWDHSMMTEERISRGEIVIDMPRHEVTVHGRVADLTPIEFNLLVYLMRHAGKVLSHRDILQNVWGHEYGNEVEYLRVYMGHLRQKVEADPLKPKYILTERGIGYRFGE
ncbi:MAG TPA: response regulator transcription factor [Anaerolineales bacterium]|nr:response regulator transcription factor [Anaerolineales bacterium]HLO32385.1 response regulator transcription factor [Anaerolineales bacterium]